MAGPHAIPGYPGVLECLCAKRGDFPSALGIGRRARLFRSAACPRRHHINVVAVFIPIILAAGDEVSTAPQTGGGARGLARAHSLSTVPVAIKDDHLCRGRIKVPLAWDYANFVVISARREFHPLRASSSFEGCSRRDGMAEVADNLRGTEAPATRVPWGTLYPRKSAPRARGYAAGKRRHDLSIFGSPRNFLRWSLFSHHEGMTGHTFPWGPARDHISMTGRRHPRE